MDLSGAKVLITGGTGFIGRHLTNRLLREGAEVTLLTRTPQDRGIPGLRDLAADLADPDHLRSCMRRAAPEIVFHLGGATNPERSIARNAETLSLNLAATLALAEAARDVQAFVHAGTSEEYGIRPAPFSETNPPSPLSPYSASKLASTLWLKMMHDSFGFPAIMARIFLCYGPGQSPPKLIPSAIHAALEGRDFPMTSGRQKREFIYVDDLVEGLIRAATTPAARGEILNFGSGQQMPIRDVVNQIYALADAGGQVQAGAIPDRPNDMMEYEADITKAGKLLGWAPRVSLEDGLARTLAWARANGDSPVPFTHP